MDVVHSRTIRPGRTSDGAVEASQVTYCGLDARTVPVSPEVFTWCGVTCPACLELSQRPQEAQ